MERAALRSEKPPAPDREEQEQERSLPDAEAFGRLVAPSSPRHRSVHELHGLLVACKPGSSQAARVEALERLARWLQGNRAVASTPGAPSGESPQVMRVRMLVLALGACPPFGARVAATLGRVLEESFGGGLFARLGVPSDRGFFAETVDRVSRRFLPEPRDDRDLLQFVARMFPWKASVRFLSSTPPELVRDLVSALGNGQTGIDVWAPLQSLVLDMSALIAIRISAVGLSDVLRARSPKVPLGQSPFFRLPRAVDALVDAVRKGGDVQTRANECHALVADCGRLSQLVVENLEQYGVSVDVVYRIELLGKSLARLDKLVRQLEPCSDLERASKAQALLTELVEIRLRDRELVDIVRSNLHLLARKIIERAGQTGEHYITSTRGEYVKMLFSAGGGGVLTAGTAALKFFVQWGHYAPFVEGMLASTNYAASFLLMQLFGFTLATKQPSMTAAALAGTLRESAGHPDLSALVTMIARITRSQLAAAIGNVGMVIPSAFAFDLFWRAKHGKSFLDETTAHYVLHSLHPLESGTIFFAALTGVILWSSSIVAGWLENWAVYRRLPEAIAEHPLGRIVGKRTMAWFSRFFLRNVAGFGGNVSIGFFLGMTPVMGKFFGLPLDVRHVTLSTGALTLSVLSLGVESLSTEATWAAAAGIAIILTLNFGVSFALALAVALRARQADRSDRWRLVRSVMATYMRSPLQFFLPPRETVTPKVHGPVSVAPPPAR
jgi:site-specific recombinase